MCERESGRGREIEREDVETEHGRERVREGVGGREWMW